MAYQIRQIEDFLKRLRMEEDPDRPTKLTWLIGAGVSFSANVPLAKGISYRIILYEYLAAELNYRPWNPDDKRGLTYSIKDLTEYFIWYEQCEKISSKSFQKLQSEAKDWLKKIPEFCKLEPDNPDCYQMLFKHFFQSSAVHHRFLTTLIGLIKGVNLAHLGLAGVLRDHPKWGHTVFTTNFDDLILKALLSINHTARIFGEVQSKDMPASNPNYPQIVHLHGRHTGYRLLNTKEQIDLIDPDLHKGFKKHISDSHLIVLGYSGWDDLVMKTLEEWKNHEGVLGGSLYWVPWKGEETLIPKMKKFLNELPPNRVYIIENSNKNLNADSFILKFCDFLNNENGGFQPYRQGILDYATRQHTFVLSQLLEHPEFDPNHALKLVNAARDKLRINEIDEVLKLKEKSKKIAQAKDINDDLKAKVFQEIGIIELLLKNYEQARITLGKAKLIWERLAPGSSRAKLEKAIVQRALGEIYIHKNELDKAKELLGNNIFFYENDDVPDAQGLGLSFLLFANISLKEGKLDKADSQLQKGIYFFKENENIKEYAHYYLLLSNKFLLQGEISNAKIYIQKALTNFEQLEDEVSIYVCKNYMVTIYLRDNKFEESESLLEEIIDFFEHKKDTLSLANAYNTKGDINYQTGNVKTALKYFEKSKTLYKRQGRLHGYTNCLADLYNSYKDINSPEKLGEIKEEIDFYREKIKNPYMNSVFKTTEENHNNSEIEDLPDEENLKL